MYIAFSKPLADQISRPLAFYQVNRTTGPVISLGMTWVIDDEYNIQRHTYVIL